ncbi:hypothetical protein H0H81_009683 [Sphagnurus paluster]|uniref:Uncharacterized protein n=1 Tax=Sphagnurus paluster TaxID=117069 RepID=A0A9P7KL12_9AGAR|nr:hypothetical protein H0H81_009683 [Sphagnurus paluster]
MKPEFSAIQFPWAQLTRLVFESVIPPGAFRSIIFQCKNLVSGSFAVNGSLLVDLESTSAISPTIVLAHLSSLTICIEADVSYSNSIHIERTLHGLGLPSIQNFQLSTTWVPIEFPSYPMIPALYATAGIHIGTGVTSLTCLIIENITFDVENFIKTLHGCTALEKLALFFSYPFAHAILAALLPQDSTDTHRSSPGPPALLNLTTFVLVVNHKHFNNFAQSLSTLVRTWARDPARCRPLEAIMVYDCERIGGETNFLVSRMFSRLRQLLGPWREEESDDLAVAESGMVLRTECWQPLQSLAKVLGWFEA